MKRMFWVMYLLCFCWPYSLKQFKIFCIKIDGMDESEWDEMEDLIRGDETLCKFFKIKKSK